MSPLDMAERIDELERQVHNNSVAIGRLTESISNLTQRLDKYIDAQQKALDRKVEKAEFNPVRSVVYGMVATVMMSFGGALISLILISSS